ncbi:MAG: hypothetical protein K2Q20_06180 [Phycisphaerales bacterium]|nr:hypothetical protein [Phycisphaerales bacterium]
MPTTVSGIGRLLAASIGFGALAIATNGQVVDATYPSPALDRWMYNFATQTGVENNISIFTSLGDPLQLNFDDHDGQFLIGFDTGPQVPAGLPTSNYRVLSATLTVRNNRNNGFRYDPSYDSWRSYLPSTDANFQADADTGRPIELYAAGYRNGFTAQTFTEFSLFSVGDSTALPQRGVRNVFAAQYDAQGVATDISNSVLGAAGTGPGFETAPLAVGIATLTAAQPNPVNPGDLVPTNTDFTFNIALGSAGTIRYLRESLAAGRLNLVVTSLAPSAMMGGSPPRFYSKEASGVPATGTAQPARLSLRVCTSFPSDWNCNGSRGVDDIFAFLSDWFAGNADFTADGTRDVSDIFAFLSSWFGAVP